MPTRPGDRATEGAGPATGGAAVATPGPAGVDAGLPGSILKFGLFALILLVPLPFGAVQPGAMLALELAAALLAAGALWVHGTSGPSFPAGWSRVVWPALALCGIGLLQLLPWPQALMRAVGAPGADARQAVSGFVPELSQGAVPYSLSPPETVDALLRLGAYAMIALATVLVLQNGRDVRQAVTVILVGAGFQAFYGSFEYLSGRQHIFGYVKQHYLDCATGTFINRNHFAGYLALALPFALGWMFGAAPVPAAGRGVRDRLIRFNRRGAWRPLVGGAACALIWVGIILSYSRAGLVAALAASLTFVALSVRGRRGLALAGLPIALATVLLGWTEIRFPAERFLETDRELTSHSGRTAAWKASLPLIAEHPLAGSGLGTFEDAFERVKPPPLTARWDHAHNDWLEAVADGGFPAAILLILIVVGAMRRPQRESAGTGPGGAVPIACIGALVALTVHATMDFSLRIPAYAALASVIVGLRFAAASIPDPETVVRRRRVAT